MSRKPKILVSACLLGQPVRYDGNYASKGHETLLELQKEGRIVLLCPEVAGGLPTPRPSAEIKGQTILDIQGNDMTAKFTLGAEKALQLCKAKAIKTAILKENSPSCGSNFIYDGTFTSTKIIGEGIVTALLRAHGIDVFSEDEIELALNNHLSPYLNP